MSRIIRCMNCNEPIAGGCCYQLDCQLCGIQQLPTAAKEAPSNLTAPRQAAPNTLGLTLLGAERVTREYFKDRPLHLHGVSRIEGHKEGLYLTFNREPTDKEFITIHELINEYIGVGNAK